MNHLSDYGQPFRVFNNQNPLYLYFTVTDIPDILEKKPCPKSYLIGTTNKFIKTLNKLTPDVIVDIDNEDIHIESEINKKILK
jgi:hypothetical protein